MYAFDLSFDPGDPFFAAPGPSAAMRWAVQIFTLENVYGIDPARTSYEVDGDRGTLRASGLSWAGQQRRCAGGVRVDVERTTESDHPGDETFTWRIEAGHDEPIKAVKLVLRDLPADALGVGWWQMTSPEGVTSRPRYLEPVRWRYPWPDDDPWPEWETPWAAAGDPATTSVVILSSRDEKVRAHRLFVHEPPWADGDAIVESIVEEDAREFDGSFVVPALRVRVIAPTDPQAARAATDEDVEAHLAHLEAVYGLMPWSVRDDVPEWFREIRLVVNLHGEHWTGYVFNTFDQMADALRFVSEHIDPGAVMAYVPGWEGRYYHDYPVYRPGAALGGADGFRRFVGVAHDLGVRVMPMFGVHGANVRRYPSWEQAAFRTRTNRMVTLVNKPDWDGDRSGEDDQVFLNPGEPNFRAHLVGQVRAVIEDFEVDGVFLDTSACWFNDPRFNLVDGYHALREELRARHPGILFAGEGWFDAMLGVFGVNQSWLGTNRRFRYPQLLERYARAVGHLSVGAPGAGSTGVHEGGYYPGASPDVAPGHIPSLAIVGDTIAEHGDAVADFCRRVGG